ncbi:hypothetical protein E4T52_06965 [Aureobasidium sp. EXF-3400]|nr:hypothetical protein E4T51_14858 [Aureobasidium sp. EXF-12344]KAI4778066.1 hypothetical protein E4T52_06965 [Aureobasidium sp. EXF-3400]
MSRPASMAGPATDISHASRPLTPKTRSMSPSNISLFVSNLRLLNLDQRQDWPDITIQTFDTKDALQNQKKRVSCVEWSLYRLFEIWDRDTTRDKLQPFFPPLEPIQSLNLRAALFRCLNELKKNDVLGREATLRKTMLDDCKGDKFEEVLLLFSAAVVRKQILSTRRKQPPSIGRNIAIAKNIDKREMSTIAPLSLAYRASLTKIMQSRATLDLTLNNFRTSLYEKTNDYHQRHLTLLEMQEATAETLPTEIETLIKRELRQNWVGSIEGCDALLAGAKVASADAHMDSTFDDLWQHFRQGTTPQVPPESISLLETLQSRVIEQNDRLRLWKTYRDVFEETNKPANPAQKAAVPGARDSAAGNYGLNIFDKHRNISVEQETPNMVTLPIPEDRVDYEQVVQDMKQGLLDVVKTKKRYGQASSHAQPASVDRVRRTNAIPRQAPIPVFLGGAKEPKEDLFSPLKRPLLESANSTPVSVRHEPHKTHQWLSRTHSQPLATPQSVKSFQGSAPNTTTRSPYGSALGQPEFAEPSLSVQRDRERYVKANTPSPLNESKAVPRNETVSSDYQAHAGSANLGHIDWTEDPITSLEHKIGEIGLNERQRSSPSPELPEYSPRFSSPPPAHPDSPERPDLSERARMSMASFRSSENSNPLPQPTPDAPTVTIDSEATDTQSRRTSLADRALASISQASLHPQPKRRTTTKERPKSAFIPSNAAQFSTPMKGGRSSLGGTRDTTPRDKLFDQDAEYASVFKSRPKIAMSPVLSPELDLQMEEAEDFSFEGNEEGEESMMRLESSPLGKFGM